MQKEDIKLSAYQKFHTENVPRSQINEAPYNPRILREGAQKRLKKKLKEVGLLTTLVWNKRSGNLVSGHQRLAQIDSLEGYPKKKKDYLLTVAVIDLDDKSEKEMVVFFNNPSAQGEWDLDGIAKLKLEDGIGFDDMGFSEADVDYMFNGDGRFSELFQDTGEVYEDKEKLKKVKEVREKGKEDNIENDASILYTTIIFESDEEKVRVCRLIGAPIYEKYINAVLIENAVRKAGGE